MSRLEEIQNLISLNKPKDAIEKIKSLKNEKHDIFQILPLIEARFERVIEENAKGTISSEDKNIELNKINDGLLYIIRGIKKEDTLKKRNTKLLILALASFIALNLILIVVYDYVNKENLLLVGSGSVHSYLEDYSGDVFSDKAFFPDIVPLNSPTLIGTNTISYAYQNGQERDRRYSNLPSILGMSSMELDDTMFTNILDAPKRLYYGIQIGLDSLFITVNEGLEGSKLKDYGLANGKELQLKELKRIIDENRLTVYANVPQSGSFNSWNSAFKSNDLGQVNIKKIKFISKINGSYNRLIDDKGTWMLLDSKKYNITNKISGGNDEIVMTDKFYSIDIFHNDSILTRPLYIYGIHGDDNDAVGQIYPICQSSICKFWDELLKELLAKGLITEKYKDNVKNEFLIMKPSIKNCGCGIKRQKSNINLKIETSGVLTKIKF